MTAIEGATFAVLLVVLVLVWDLRRARRAAEPETERVRVGAQPEVLGAPRPDDFTGAIPPERYVVVRWPLGIKHYGGCLGADARQVYEHQHPKPGETVEFWELGERRGIKEA